MTKRERTSEQNKKMLVLSILGFLVAISIIAFIPAISSRDIVLLQGANFELALTTYKYIAILFYDESDDGLKLEAQWSAACDSVDVTDLPVESEMAKINGNDPELKEIIDAYGITLPSIRVFRKGIMAEYRGPFDSEGIAAYIIEDAQPSVKTISSIKEMKAVLSENLNSVVFGLMNIDDTAGSADEAIEGYSIDPWGQFQAAADSLRGHASFYLVTSEDVRNSFKLRPKELPVVYMVSNEGDGFVKYSGEILEMNLSEWVLRNSAPAMGELTVASSKGELYATQFFSSRKLKFILFITPALLSSGVLDIWKDIAYIFKGKAIFSYMAQSAVADVVEYFDIDVNKDIPMIVAHQPVSDLKYKSKKIDIKNKELIQEFVAGVISGTIPNVLKSEPIPPVVVPPSGGSKASTTIKAAVLKVVGSNVLEVVSNKDKDVLLLVFAPWCEHCKKLIPTYDILVRAVQGESRIVIAKINALANDIPASWGVKAFPTLLWFPAKDKPYKGTPVPKSYWDAGYSLHELVGFVQREGSFDPKSLKVATNEQLGTLIGEEEGLRIKYESDERQFRRNEGREVFDNVVLDYMLGEVVFDGRRWHLAAAAVLGAVSVVSVYFIVVFGFSGGINALKSPPVVVRKKKAA